MAETTTTFKQAVNGLRSIGEGPGRQIYQLPTAGAGQQAIQYPLLFKALGNLTAGRNTDAFNPIEANAMRKFHGDVVPSIAQRFAGEGNTAASSGFMGELGKAGTDLQYNLAAERAKFGQEEERLRQSELDQLLKFAFVPTSERVLMSEPGKLSEEAKKNVPQTVDNQIANLIEPYKAPVKEAAANIANTIKGGASRLLEQGKGAVGMGSGKAGAAKVPTDKINTEAAKVLSGRNPTSKRMLDEIINVGGGYPASQYASLNNPKTAITEEGLLRLNKLANYDAFRNSTNPILKQALMNLRNEKEIDSMLKFVETGNVNYIPRSVRQGNDYWKKVYNREIKNIPGINEGKK